MAASNGVRWLQAQSASRAASVRKPPSTRERPDMITRAPPVSRFGVAARLRFRIESAEPETRRRKPGH
jgi:hypothetical protein